MIGSVLLHASVAAALLISWHFTRDLKTSTMSAQEIKTATWIGRLGFAARGIVFALIGVIIAHIQVGEADPLTRGAVCGAPITAARSAPSP